MIAIPAKIESLPRIVSIYKNAVQAMNDNNIFQWDELYPDVSILKKDILAGDMLTGVENETIVSAVVLSKDFDAQYLNGKWSYLGENFIIIHRLCVDPAYQNRKIGTNTLLLAEALAKNNNIKSIRLDAFSQNPSALRLYENLGYKKAGRVSWRTGEFYLYEKMI